MGMARPMWKYAVCKITIVISDKGPGIEDLNCHAGGFHRADSIREMGFGAGMGLPNIKHADELVINTEKGKGTAVTITVYF